MKALRKDFGHAGNEKVKFAILLLLIISISLSSFAQQKINPKAINGDITHSISIKRDTVHCLFSPLGSGQIEEVNALKTDSTSLEKEHNSIWYKYESKANCEFSFTLIPDNAKDDYDFMVFLVDKKSTDSLRLLRTNKARCDETIAGITGLRKRTTATFVGEGPGLSFSQPINTQEGETYYILVDNVYSGGQGHRLLIGNKCHSKTKKTFNLSVVVQNKETKELMEGKIRLLRIQYPNAPDTIINSVGMQYFSPLDSGSSYKLQVEADSFLTYRIDFKVYKTDTMKTVVARMQKIEVGKKIKLENIYFSGGTAVMLHKSVASLKDLAQALQDNPGIEIEIQGHVNQPLNWPKKERESYYQDLSDARAKAVYDYLIKRNIDPKRLKYKGFSYSQMLFPYASNPNEEEQNRRVEILILKM